MRILIVGHGVVGKNLEEELEVLHPDVIDKYKPEENKLKFITESVTILHLFVWTRRSERKRECYAIPQR